MNTISFFKTDDGSTGLYSEEANDIFHSKTGALKEACDKFIIPSRLSSILSQKNKINILDLCTGIGYNLKAALSCISGQFVYFDCVDKNKNLSLISPFILDGTNNDELNIFILFQLFENNYTIDEISSILFEFYIRENKQFFSASMANFIKFLFDKGYIYSRRPQNLSFLHNIYYHYISISNYSGIKLNRFNNCKITYYFDDARSFIKNSNIKYDIVFHDGFTPQKDPVLWTIDFLSEIKKHLTSNSILVSYSKSTPFRSALLKLNFFVGKTYIDSIDMGTIASLNENYIENKLTDYDLGLINTRSGIVYKDEGLFHSSTDIIKLREIEQKSSNLISHTKFLKNLS